MKPALSSLNARRPSKLMPLFAAAALTAAAGCSPGPAGSAPPPAYSSTAGSRPPAATASSAQVPPEDFCADADQDRSFDDCSGFIDAAENAAFYGGAVPYYRRSSGGLAGRSPAASQPSKTAPGSTVENKAPAPAVPAPETTKRAGTFTKSGDGAGGTASGTTAGAAGAAAGGGTSPPAQAGASKGSTAGTEASGGTAPRHGGPSGREPQPRRLGGTSAPPEQPSRFALARFVPGRLRLLPGSRLQHFRLPRRSRQLQLRFLRMTFFPSFGGHAA
ncbi:hypothetical protein [Paenibacillus mucilaginosus]|uniref:hypothetical protein n=1 Tax=Paenibacillus mucilaginosus TaxID=61624 RepID=UPI00240E0D63|nr:hypothetical protein [Paenibacillus mucilaginosus]